MAMQSKEAYTMEYPPEKLKFREHFSSLWLAQRNSFCWRMAEKGCQGYKMA